MELYNYYCHTCGSKLTQLTGNNCINWEEDRPCKHWCDLCFRQLLIWLEKQKIIEKDGKKALGFLSRHLRKEEENKSKNKNQSKLEDYLKYESRNIPPS